MTDQRNGVLLVDKPGGMTSHDVVARVRRALATKKVGHAGTLDPMATGLLVLGVGPSTRLLTHLVGLDKEYLATIRLGQATTTDDAEGEVLVSRRPAASSTSDVGAITAAAIDAGIAALTGEIQQRPSSVSAIRVDGQRAYDRVRAGEDVDLPARPVVVREFELLASRPAGGGTLLDLDVRVVCSSGTYIRALARDLGEALAVGGHLTALRRTRVGPFSVAEAVPPPERVPRDAPPPAAPVLRAPAEIAGALFPVLRLDEQQSADLANGKRLRVDLAEAQTAAAVSPDGRLVGLVTVSGGETRVQTNFPWSAEQ